MKATKKAREADRLERKRLARVDRELAREKPPKPAKDAESTSPPASDS